MTNSWLIATIFCIAIGGIAIGGIAIFRRAPGAGVGIGVAVSVLVPTWVLLLLGNWPLDVRLATAAVLVSAYCFHPNGHFVSRPTMIDLSLIALLIWHVVSDWVNSGFDILLPLRAYGEWALPFVAGWFAIMHRGSVSLLAPWFVGAIAVAGVLAIPEMFMGINLWETCFGKVDDLVDAPTGQRYGFFYRAMGPTRHPIFFAIVLLLFVPWAAALAREERRREWRVCGWLGLFAIIAGMVATLSRGPLLGLIIAGSVVASYYSIAARRTFAIASVVGALAAVIGWSTLIDILDRTEQQDYAPSLVEIDGEFEQYTGTRNRLFVMRIYAPLVLRGGAVGYGTPAVSSFPPNIPGLPVEARARHALRIVDNSYVLLGLRFGWVGLAFFILLLGSSIYTSFSLATRQSLVTYPNGPAFLVTMGGVLVGTCFEILTVFSSYEFFFWILFCCGVVSGLSALDLRLQRGEAQDF